MAGADDRKRFVSRKMRQRFFERAGEMELRSIGSDAQDGFAEMVDAVSGGFESLSGGIIRRAGDNDLQRMIGEEYGGEAVGGGEEAVLRGDSGESLKSFLGEDVVAFVTGKGVHSNEGDGGDGISAGCGGILEGFAADIEAAHGRGVGGTIEEAAALGVAVAGDDEVHGFLRGLEIARIERGFVGVEEC